MMQCSDTSHRDGAGRCGLSLRLGLKSAGPAAGSKVEVAWNPEFKKYQVTRLLTPEVPLSAASFFNHVHQ